MVKKEILQGEWWRRLPALLLWGLLVTGLTYCTVRLCGTLRNSRMRIKGRKIVSRMFHRSSSIFHLWHIRTIQRVRCFSHSQKEHIARLQHSISQCLQPSHLSPWIFSEFSIPWLPKRLVLEWGWKQRSCTTIPSCGFPGYSNLPHGSGCAWGQQAVWLWHVAGWVAWCAFGPQTNSWFHVFQKYSMLFFLTSLLAHPLTRSSPRFFLTEVPPVTTACSFRQVFRWLLLPWKLRRTPNGTRKLSDFQKPPV